jgi:hypothetical protein
MDGALQKPNESGRPKALFLAYQRTAFTDALRTARLLKAEGTFEPIFIVSVHSEDVAAEIAECERLGVACYSERALERPRRRHGHIAAAQESDGREGGNAETDTRGVTSSASSPAEAAALTIARELRPWTFGRLVAGLTYKLTRPIYYSKLYSYRAGSGFAKRRHSLRQKNGGVPGAHKRIAAQAAIAIDKATSRTTSRIVEAIFALMRRDVVRTLLTPTLSRWSFPAAAPRLRLSPNSRMSGSRKRRRRAPTVPRKYWFDSFRKLVESELRYRRSLLTLKIDVVILPEDLLGPITSPLIRAARCLGIPSVIVPNPIEIALACHGNMELHLTSLRDLIVATRYPKWRLCFQDYDILRTTPDWIIATELAGLSPPSPWVPNSGYADRIAIESECMLSIYAKLGFSSHQLAVTGSATDDLLYRGVQEKHARRERIYAELGLPPGRSLLLSSLVPDQLVGSVPYCEFDNHRELLEFWVQSLAKWREKFNIILKFSPRVRREDLLYLESYGVVVAPHDTVDLAPLADIYVASISSTLRWAAACGIPAINYDVYHYRYGDYENAPGIIHAETKEEFLSALDRLAGDDEFRASVRRRQEADAPHWGKLDGHSIDRLVNLLEELRREAAVSVGSAAVSIPDRSAARAFFPSSRHFRGVSDQTLGN